MQDFFAWIHVRVPIFCGMVCVSQVSQDTQTRGTQLLVIRCILTCMFCVCFAQWMNVLLTMAVVNTSVRIPLYHLPVPALMGFL